MTIIPLSGHLSSTGSSLTDERLAGVRVRGGFRYMTVPSSLGRGLIILAGVVLSACAARPQGILVPIGAEQEPPGASTVSMLVATSRKPSGDPATLFTGERSPTLSFTNIDVSIPADRAKGTVQWPSKLPPDPRTDFAVVEAREMDIPQARNWVETRRTGGRVLVFIHGFNNRYEDAVLRFAQFVHDANADITPVLFTWPSRARLLDYNYDKESTNYSRTALEQTLRALASDRSVTDITVLAHSMGTWLAMEALRQMGVRDGHVASKIRNVILASPDLDVDVFARQWTELGSDKPKFTIMVSRDDRALAASRLLSGGVERVGQIDPAAEPFKSKLEAAGITVVDLTNIRTEDSLKHSKFAESPEIVKLIGGQLASGQQLTAANNSGLAEGVGAVIVGTAGTIGKVAAASVTAPIAVVEGATYRPVGDNLSETLAAKPGG
jgi:esterase/lipase superfamily enzyme